MNVLKLFSVFLIAYAGAWTVCYFIVMGRDVRYFFQYLFLAWSNQAGEMPAFIHVVALGFAVFAAITVAAIALMRRGTSG